MDAGRMDGIRREIGAGEYETPGRLFGTVAAVALALRGACIVPGCKNRADFEAEAGDSEFCTSCIGEFIVDG